MAQRLHALHHIGLLISEGGAERLRPVELVVHLLDDLREGHQRFDAGIPGHWLQRGDQRIAVDRRVMRVRQPALRLDQLDRIGRGHQDVAQERVRIERHGRQHLVELGRGVRRRRALLLSRLTRLIAGLRRRRLGLLRLGARLRLVVRRRLVALLLLRRLIDGFAPGRRRPREPPPSGSPAPPSLPIETPPSLVPPQSRERTIVEIYAGHGHFYPEDAFFSSKGEPNDQLRPICVTRILFVVPAWANGMPATTTIKSAVLAKPSDSAQSAACSTISS